MSSKIDILKRLKVKSGLHSPSPKEIEGALGFNPIKIDFCFLSNPYATDLVISHYKNRLSEKQLFSLFESYPASSDYVAGNISKFEGIAPEKIVMSNGAIQAIEWVSEYWAVHKLLIPIPTFSTYYEYLDSRYVFGDRRLNAESCTANDLLSEADRKGCDSILLIMPNNPTGHAMSLNEFTALVNNLGSKKLIVDESFCHFMDYYSEYKEYRNTITNKNIVFIKSMSKDFGVAGIRLGYLHTYDEELLCQAKSKTTWNLNNFAVLFSEILGEFRFQGSYELARELYLKARRKFFEDLKGIEGITVYESQANFFLIELEVEREDFVYRLLLQTGIYVRTMEDKVGLSSRFIRVACRKEEENDYFIRCFRSLINES